MRVQSFRDTTTENLHESVVEMGLSRYKHIIIHVGEHDIDKDISPDSFKEKYQSLLDFLKTVGSKLFVSGLLPRGGTDLKIFNKDLCLENNAECIDNHNSFIMASGELPFDLFHVDQVNLKFSGIRKLFYNINGSCSVFPQTQSCLRPRNPNRGQRRPRYFRNNPIYKNRMTRLGAFHVRLSMKGTLISTIY